MDTGWLGDRRDVVVIDGPDAATYLQSQASQDLRGMVVGDARWTFLLQPTGRVEVLARVTMVDAERFELDTDPGFGPALEARLNRFKIRVKATVTAVERPVGSIDANDDQRIAAAWPKMGAEIIPGETIPAETGLAETAVSFTKGCYPGQELVERMDSRGSTAPRHLTVLPRRPDDAPGAAVISNGVEIGQITSVGSTNVLAYVKRAHDGAARETEAMAATPTTAKNLDRMRSIALALPEATEEVTWGTDINFRVRKKIFAFPGQGDSLTVKADRDELPALLADDRFSPAPYLARGGWVRMDLTAGAVDWVEIGELIRTSYCLIAPKKLSAQLD